MDIITGFGLEGSPLILRARIHDASGAILTPSDIDTITYEIWTANPPPNYQVGQWQNEWIATSPPAKIKAETALIVAECMLEDLGEWSQDTEGYNFRAVIPAADIGSIDIVEFPKGQWVRVEVNITPIDGEISRPAFWAGVKQSLYGKD